MGALTDPACAGIVITGPAGVGKTALARAVTTDAGSQVHWAYASPGAADIPFGALAELLLFADVDAADPTSYLLAARGRLALSDDRPILVVDDAPLLDHASVVLVTQLVRAGDVRLVLTVRQGQTLADELGRLLDDRTLDELVLAPLDGGATIEVVEEALGGPIEPDLGHVVHVRSGGNALFVRELVTAARDDGTISWGRGTWRLSGELPVSERLVDAVRRRITAVDGDRLLALRAVALGAPLPLDAALTVSSPAVLADLESAGLITTEVVAGRPSARVAHPLVGDAVQAGIAPLDRRALVETLATAVGADDPSNPDRVLRWAVQRLDSAVPVPVESLVLAASHAFTLLEHPLAERIARAAVDAGDPFESRLLLGAALSAQLRIAEGEEVLVAAVDIARDESERARALGRLGLHVAIRAGRVQDALKLLREGVDSLDDPAWRTFLSADLTKIEVMAGEAFRDAAAPRSRDVVARANECIAGALLGALGGDISTALACAEEGLELADHVRSMLPNITDLMLLGRYLALGFSGDAAAADALAVDQIERARSGRSEPLGMWIALRASTALLVGDTTSAIALAGEARPLVAERDFVGGFLAQTTAVEATARAQLGEVGTARQLLDEIDPMWLADTKTALQVAIGEAWITLAGGRGADGRVADVVADSAARRVVAAARSALDAGLVVLAGLAAFDAVRMGRPHLSLDVLTDAADRAPRSLLPAFLAAAHAAVAEAPAAIESTADGLAGVGAPNLASEALVRAGRSYRRRSLPDDARRVERRAVEWGATPVPDSTLPTPLAPREREIAQLAAARWRSREIAERLGISARTVDNTLARLYRKLDIGGRDALAARLDDLGLLDPSTPSPGEP
jgi:DNA-binding CsgD family transcriptional regulator